MSEKRTFRLEGVSYRAPLRPRGRTSETHVVVLKPDGYFDAFADVLGHETTRNVLEFGIYEGGSTMAFASLMQPDKIVAIDLADPKPLVDAARARHPRAERIAFEWSTSQDDEARVPAIIDRHFDGPLDLVIDDASHFYEETKRAFELAFPHLRAGGVYAIEDWSWAHMPGFAMWTDKAALSNLILDLMMASVSRPDLIEEVRVFPGVAFVRKGQAKTADPFVLDDLIFMQDRKRVLL